METTPETLMKQAFNSLFRATNCMKRAERAYRKRMQGADKENAENVARAIEFMSQAYDEVSAIWENDMDK